MSDIFLPELESCVRLPITKTLEMLFGLGRRSRCAHRAKTKTTQMIQMAMLPLLRLSKASRRSSVLWKRNTAMKSLGRGLLGLKSKGTLLASGKLGGSGTPNIRCSLNTHHQRRRVISDCAGTIHFPSSGSVRNSLMCGFLCGTTKNSL